MLRTSEERFFKLFLWYFLKIFSFYNKIMYWQAHISHSHPNLDFFTLLNFPHLYFLYFSFLFLLVQLGFWLCLLSFRLIFTLTSIFLCAFPLTLFSSSSAFFLTSFFSAGTFYWCICQLFLLVDIALSPTPFSSPSSLSSSHSFLFFSEVCSWQTVIRNLLYDLAFSPFCNWMYPETAVITVLFFLVNIFPQNNMLLDDIKCWKVVSLGLTSHFRIWISNHSPLKVFTVLLHGSFSRDCVIFLTKR